MIKYLCILLLSLVLCDADQSNNIITIIGTTNVHGEVDPCG